MNAARHVIRIAGSDVRFDAEPGDNLLRAGLRSGVGLAHECNAGGCGTCKFDLVGGTVQDLWPDAPGLSDRERGRGRRLACQCVPTSDCEIKMRRGDEFIAEVPPLRFEAEFKGSRTVTADIRAFRFLGDVPARFAPGQYALLTMPGIDQPRAYSMSNQPNERGEWEFMIRRVAGGCVSPLLFDALRDGDRVQVDGPLGLAHWRPESARDVVCIAGGSGIAPMLSIANAATAGRRDGQLTRLFYGGRTPADIPAFDDWLYDASRVGVLAAVSAAAPEGGDDWTGERGFIHEVALRTLAGDHASTDFYLARPPPMIETIVRLLVVDCAVPADRIHYDRFF